MQNISGLALCTSNYTGNRGWADSAAASQTDTPKETNGSTDLLCNAHLYSATFVTATVLWPPLARPCSRFPTTRPMFDLLAWLNYSAFDPRLVFHILLFLPLLLQNQGFTEDEDQTPPLSAVNPQWRMALYRTLHPSLLAPHYSFRLILLLLPGRDQISSLEEAPTDSGSCISYFLRTEAINYHE